MTSAPLDSLLATAQEYNASDLHIIAGVPPAFRVNGGTILEGTARLRLALTPRGGSATTVCVRIGFVAALETHGTRAKGFRSLASPEGSPENSPAVYCRVLGTGGTRDRKSTRLNSSHG